MASPTECMTNHGTDNDPFWRCPCGNDPAESGFSACNALGQPQVDACGAPAPGWNAEHLGCNDCGRIFRVEDGEIVRGANPEILQPLQEKTLGAAAAPRVSGPTAAEAGDPAGGCL